MGEEIVPAGGVVAKHGGVVVGVGQAVDVAAGRLQLLDWEAGDLTSLGVKLLSFNTQQFYVETPKCQLYFMIRIAQLPFDELI